MSSVDLTHKWNNGTLTQQDVKYWIARQSEMRLLTEVELNHVAMCMHHIYLWHMKGHPMGHFLTALVRNDFMEACGKADDTNRRVLSLYAMFLYNVAPYDYKKRRE